VGGRQAEGARCGDLVLGTPASPVAG
jgi:hypothetical protein